MIKLNERNALLFWLMLVATFGYAIRYGHAQESPESFGDHVEPSTDPRTDVELGVAVAGHEATWNTLDARVIVGIIARRARGHGVSFREEILAHHATGRLRLDRASNPSPEDSRPWIGDLREDCHEPQSWQVSNGQPNPDIGEWRNFRARCRQLFDAVRETLANPRANDPCLRASGLSAQIWGGPRLDAVHLERRERQGYHAIACGGTSNVYMTRQVRR